MASIRRMGVWALVLGVWSLMHAQGLRAGDEIRVLALEDPVVDQEEIRLGDVARIEAPVQLLALLEDVVLGRAPLPGNSRSLYENQVRRRISRADIRLPDNALEWPEKITVHRRAIEISEAELEEIIRHYVREQLFDGSSDIRITRIDGLRALVLPTGARIVHEVIPPRRLKPAGSIPITVRFQVDDHFETKLRTYVRVEAFTEVVLAAKPLGRYKPIKASDLVVQRMSAASIPDSAFSKPENVIGKRTLRQVEAMTVLQPSLVEQVPVVERGDIIRLVAESARVRISVLGEARRPGKPGERIPVINLDSRKKVYARVVDAETAVVDF